MPILTTLDPRCPSIRLTGDIDMPVAYALMDELNLLHNYYQFRTIELQIDSPGGNADALHHLVQVLAPWRSGNGRILKTVGLNEVCSAAALLLSFGTVGHRSAYGHSRLLYHHVRTVFQSGTAQTLSQLRVTGKRLDKWEQTFLDLLVSHVAPNLKDEAEKAAYRKKLKRLFEQERYISAAEAQQLQLLDKVI